MVAGLRQRRWRLGPCCAGRRSGDLGAGGQVNGVLGACRPGNEQLRRSRRSSPGAGPVISALGRCGGARSQRACYHGSLGSDVVGGDHVGVGNDHAHPRARQTPPLVAWPAHTRRDSLRLQFPALTQGGAVLCSARHRHWRRAGGSRAETKLAAAQDRLGALVEPAIPPAAWTAAGFGPASVSRTTRRPATSDLTRWFSDRATPRSDEQRCRLSCRESSLHAGPMVGVRPARDGRRCSSASRRRADPGAARRSRRAGRGRC